MDGQILERLPGVMEAYKALMESPFPGCDDFEVLALWRIVVV